MKKIYFITLFASLLLTACKKSETAPPTNEQPPPEVKVPIVITGFSPKLGKTGTRITITGSGFVEEARYTYAFINGKSGSAKVISATPTSIVIETTEATEGGKISLQINNQTATSTDEFDALPAEDLKITTHDKQGQLGKTISFTGNGFGKDKSKLTVSFGGTTPVPISYLGDYTIQVTVPRYAKEGKITVYRSGFSASSDGILQFAMSVVDYSPKTAAVGDTLKFTGYRFTTASDMEIKFDGYIRTYPIKVTPTEMWVKVPSNAKTSNITVRSNSLNLDDLLSEEGLKFTLK